jgi:hypothetical protein
MNLYIETDSNGNPINHPAFEDNLIQAFGVIPNHWEPFIRVNRPVPNVYQVLNKTEATYQKIDGVWTDVWIVRDMTEEEKLAHQNEVKQEWASRPNSEYLKAWVFNEETCSFDPPIPMPNDGKQYFWQGVSNSWVELPPYPNDGKRYKIDNPTATWIEISNPTV